MSATTLIDARTMPAARTSGFARVVAVLRREIAAYRSARQLAAMDDAQLHDIGLDRGGVNHAVRYGRGEAVDVRPSGAASARLPLSLTEWR